MLFPLVTNAKYYAYEARPHGLVFGFAALAALTWQRAHDSRRRILWLVAFCASLTAAELTHAYAVILCIPLGLAELYRVVRTHRLDWGVFCCIGISGLIAAPFLIIVVRAYRQVVDPAGIHFAAPTFDTMLRFFQYVLEPAMLVIVVCLALFTLSHVFHRETGSILSGENSILVSCDLALALSFLALPVFAAMLALVTKGPFLDRYFISTVIGVALLVSFGAAALDGSRWLPLSIAAVLAFSAVIDPLRVWKHRRAGIGEVLIQPNSLYRLNTTPGNPMAAYDALRAAERSALPIVVTSPLEYAYLFEYAPQMRTRFWYVSPGDLLGRVLRLEREWCGQNYNLDYPGHFFTANHRLLLYGRPVDVLAFLNTYRELQVRSVLSRTEASYDEQFLVEAETKE
jgi:hypothetical protein